MMQCAVQNSSSFTSCELGIFQPGRGKGDAPFFLPEVQGGSVRARTRARGDICFGPPRARHARFQGNPAHETNSESVFDEAFSKLVLRPVPKRGNPRRKEHAGASVRVGKKEKIKKNVARDGD